MAVAKGTLKPDREKDKLAYTLGRPEHTGHIRGISVVLWRHGFSVDIEAYRSRCRRKAEQEEKMHALEELVVSIEGAMVVSQRQK